MSVDWQKLQDLSVSLAGPTQVLSMSVASRAGFGIDLKSPTSLLQVRRRQNLAGRRTKTALRMVPLPGLRFAFKVMLFDADEFSNA